MSLKAVFQSSQNLPMLALYKYKLDYIVQASTIIEFDWYHGKFTRSSSQNDCEANIESFKCYSHKITNVSWRCLSFPNFIRKEWWCQGNLIWWSLIILNSFSFQWDLLIKSNLKIILDFNGMGLVEIPLKNSSTHSSFFPPYLTLEKKLFG